MILDDELKETNEKVQIISIGFTKKIHIPLSILNKN